MKRPGDRERANYPKDVQFLCPQKGWAMKMSVTKEIFRIRCMTVVYLPWNPIAMGQKS